MIRVFIIGALPFIPGGVQNRFMLRYTDFALPYILISFLFLLVWGCIAFLIRRRLQSTAKIVIFLNLIAAADLILLAVQEFIIHAYWMNFLGKWSQLFYLPVLNLGFRMTPWSHTIFPAYAVSFVLMLAASFIGCKLSGKTGK